ncbi:MAG: hypothetical protein AB7T19_11215 [Planctomycetota bacterium]
MHEIATPRRTPLRTEVRWAVTAMATAFLGNALLFCLLFCVIAPLLPAESLDFFLYFLLALFGRGRG